MQIIDVTVDVPVVKDRQVPIIQTVPEDRRDSSGDPYVAAPLQDKILAVTRTHARVGYACCVLGTFRMFLPEELLWTDCPLENDY